MLVSFLFVCFGFFFLEREGLTVSNSLCKPVWLWTHKDPHQWGWGWASLVLGLKALIVLIDNFIIPYSQLKSSIIHIKIFLVVFKLELSITIWNLNGSVSPKNLSQILHSCITKCQNQYFYRRICRCGEILLNYKTITRY